MATELYRALGACAVASAATAARGDFINPTLTVRVVEAFVANPGVGQDSDSRSTIGVDLFNEAVFASALGQGRIASASASQRSEFLPDRILFGGGGTLSENPAGGPEITTNFRSEGLFVFSVDEPTDFLLFGVSSNAGVNLLLFRDGEPAIIDTTTTPSESVRLEGSLAPGQYSLFFQMAVGGDTDPRPDESFSFAASASFQFVVPAPMTCAPLLGFVALRRRR